MLSKDSIKIENYQKIESAQIEFESDTLYLHNGRHYQILNEKLTKIQCLRQGLKALFLTVITFGIGLCFSPIFNLWQQAIKGKIKHYVYSDTIPENLKKINRVSLENLNAKKTGRETSAVVPVKEKIDLEQKKNNEIAEIEIEKKLPSQQSIHGQEQNEKKGLEEKNVKQASAKVDEKPFVPPLDLINNFELPYKNFKIKLSMCEPNGINEACVAELFIPEDNFEKPIFVCEFFIMILPKYCVNFSDIQFNSNFSIDELKALLKYILKQALSRSALGPDYPINKIRVDNRRGGRYTRMLYSMGFKLDLIAMKKHEDDNFPINLIQEALDFPTEENKHISGTATEMMADETLMNFFKAE